MREQEIRHKAAEFRIADAVQLLTLGPLQRFHCENCSEKKWRCLSYLLQAFVVARDPVEIVIGLSQVAVNQHFRIGHSDRFSRYQVIWLTSRCRRAIRRNKLL
jgi:hypothetical protein